MRDSYAVPVDRDGLVIYFAINGRPFLFNGHNGSFYDSLPDYAVGTLDAFAGRSGRRAGTAIDFRMKYGSRCESLLDHIRLYRSGTHPDLAPEPRQEKFLQGGMPNVFNVYAAQACNLSCSYCFNQRGTFGRTPSLMSEQTARSLVGFITKIFQSGQHPVISVNLFGGEPLLALRAVHILARGLQDLNHRNLPARIHLVLSTNGTIYNKKIFDVFAERPDLSTVVVSLDASKKMHDRNRPFAGVRRRSSGSSYDTVLRNLRRMMREKVPYSVTCVVPHPYDYVGAAEALHRLGIKRLEIKQLIRHIYGQPTLPERFKRDFQLWRKRYLAYSDYYLDHLRSENPVRHVSRFTLIGDYARALGTGTTRTLACGIGDVKVGVTADGRLMPCESFLGHESFEIGNVEQGLHRDRFERFEQWILSRGQHRLDHRRCKTCYAKLVCGGGCYALNYDRTGRLNPLPASSCRYIREMTKIDLYYISRMRKELPGIYAEITGEPAQH